MRVEDRSLAINQWTSRGAESKRLKSATVDEILNLGIMEWIYKPYQLRFQLMIKGAVICDPGIGGIKVWRPSETAST